MSYGWRLGLVMGLLGAVVPACEPENGGIRYSSSGWAGTTGDDAGLISGDGGPSTSPLLAKIDPGGTMVQTPGQGVGVFTQYEAASDAGKLDSAGHWYVWWTCDTDISGESCPFNIQLSVAHGGITDAVSEGFGGSDGLEPGTSGANGDAPKSITANTTTTSSVQGVRFDTEPDAVLTVSAALGGEYSGSFLFFVEDGRVNGGYEGTVTDPLQLQSTSP